MAPVDEYADMPELQDINIAVPQDRVNQTRARLDPPSGGEVVVLQGRDARLPVMYRVDSHPQLAHVQGVGNVYIYMEDTDPDAMLDYLDYVRDLVLPDGTSKGVQTAGYLELAPGDYIFARDVWGTGQPEDDVIQAWVTPEGLIVGSLATTMEAARDAVLGEAEDRSPQKATVVDGEYVGGIAWERDGKAVNIRNSERAYGLSQSYQIQKNLTGPSVGAKLPAMTQPTAHNKLRLQTVQAAAPIAIASLESGPKTVYDALRLQAEVTNLPRVGYEGNYAFPTMQLNIASTKSSDTLAAAHFKDDLGQFAGKHVDKHDSAGGYTCMIAMNDLAPGEDPGYFMIAELGVAIVLNRLVSCCFCGLRYHGSFPPTAAAGATPSDWSYRFVVVCYPSAPILDGSSLVALGALPKGELLAITPEMKDPCYDHVQAGTNCANWIADGPCLTTRQAYLDFVHRATGELLYYLTNQVPSDIQFELDFDVFRQSMSLLDENDQRITPTPWDLHPGSTHKSDIFDCTRKDSVKLWDDHKKKHGRFMPHFVFTETKPEGHPRLKNGSRSTNKNAKPRRPRVTKQPVQHDTVGSSDEDEEEDELEEEDEQPGSQSGQEEAGPVDAGNKGKRKEVPSAETSPRRSKRLRVEAMNAAQDSDSEADVPCAEEPIASGSSQRLETRQVGSVASSQADRPLRGLKPNTEQVTFKENTFATSTFDKTTLNCDMNICEALEQANVEVLDMDDTPSRQPANDRFKDVLDLFTLSRLQDQLARLERVAVRVEELNSSGNTLQGLDSFFERLQTAPRGSASFAREVADLWHVWPVHAELLDLTDLTLAVERRRLMISNAAAWLWLTQDCVSQARSVVTALLTSSDSHAIDFETSHSCEWLTTLVRDVHGLWSLRKGGDVLASRYLPDLHVAQESIHISRISTRGDTSEVADTICVEVIRVVRDWLGFPSNTQLLAGYFVVYLVATFKNVDLLLFPDIWRFHQGFKTLVLGHTAHIRHHTLKLSSLDPLLHALQVSPAADPQSKEAETLRRITSTVTRCSPTLHAFAEAMETLLNIDSGCPAQPSIAIASRYRSDAARDALKQPEPPLPPPIPSQHRLLPADSTISLQSHGRLLAFIQLLPLAQYPTHTPTTPAQRLVSSKLDHFLPFREHAPTRQTVTGEGGPFHPSLATKPGAFASQVMSRALLFNSPAIHNNLTKGYFVDPAAWLHFLEEQGYDGTLHSIAGLVNQSCYGSAQLQQVEILKDVAPYFAREQAWDDLLKSSGGKVSFAVCLRWLQDTYAGRRGGNGTGPVKYLPLLGPLTAYLLTADFVYAGRVTAPTVEELGVIIHNNNLGSRNCLTILSPQYSSTSVASTTVSMFKEIYTFLSNTLTSEEKAAITFDPIMLEHLLCKYQRVQRRLTAKKTSKAPKARK